MASLKAFQRVTTENFLYFRIVYFICHGPSNEILKGKSNNIHLPSFNSLRGKQ